MPLNKYWTVRDMGYSTPCWVWNGAKYSAGYGAIHRSGRTHRAHRWVYEQLVGPIPEGLHLDHLCTVKPCVRPEHLEPVTMAENARRYWLPIPRKTACPRGHPKVGGRCAICARMAQRAFRERKRREREEWRKAHPASPVFDPCPHCGGRFRRGAGMTRHISARHQGAFP